MDKYEEEMFNFLTIEENLKGLIIAKDQFDSVRNKLIQNFWNKVKSNLTEHFKESSRWVVRMDSNIFEQFSKLYLIDRSICLNATVHPLVFFCWESLSESHPYYGICTHVRLSEIERGMLADIISQEKALLNNDKFSAFGKSDYWPIKFDDCQLDFRKDQTLLELIPTKQAELAKQFSDQLIDVFNSFQGGYKRILNECDFIKKV